MKKTLAWLFCILMCLSLFPTVHAANPGDIGFETSLALQLKQLGLFRGASEQEDGTADFDLNREPSREEALIMLIRALGKEDKARGYGKTHPFTDVPAWADGYVSYAYENGLTKGVSDTRMRSPFKKAPLPASAAKNSSRKGLKTYPCRAFLPSRKATDTAEWARPWM